MRFELNSRGVKDLLNSNEMKTILESVGNQVVSAAGGEYEAETIGLSTRPVVRVSPASKKAYHENMKENVLLKALGGTHI